MIVDDLVTDWPETHDIVRTTHGIRVPWRMITRGALRYDAHHGVCYQEIDGRPFLSWLHQMTNRKDALELAFKELCSYRLPFKRVIVTSTFAEHFFVLAEEIEERFLVSVGYLKQSDGSWAVYPWAITLPGRGSAEMPRAVFDWVALRMKEVGKSYDRASVEARIHDSEQGGIAAPSNVSLMIIQLTAKLLTCKNVVQEEVVHTDALERARKKRGHLPLYRYHVLQVTMPSKASASQSYGVGGEAVALHWVRGHFKRFTEARKLFGRITGLYWWQPHMAGRAERICDKDYKIAIGA